MSVISGWYSLGRVYNTNGWLAGKTFVKQSADMGFRYYPVHFGKCLTVIIADDVLFLHGPFSFRFLAPDLNIPLSDVKSMHARNYMGDPAIVIYIEGRTRRIVLTGDVVSHMEERFLSQENPRTDFS